MGHHASGGTTTVRRSTGAGSPRWHRRSRTAPTRHAVTQQRSQGSGMIHRHPGTSHVCPTSSNRERCAAPPSRPRPPQVGPLGSTRLGPRPQEVHNSRRHDTNSVSVPKTAAPRRHSTREISLPLRTLPWWGRPENPPCRIPREHFLEATEPPRNSPNRWCHRGRSAGDARIG